VVTLPPRMGSFNGSSSDDGLSLDPSPSPDPVPVTPPIVQSQLDLIDLWQFQPTFYYAGASSQVWLPYE
ncbi:hypothetical protein FRC00_004266, partial [Tulasnella sp. 408]